MGAISGRTRRHRRHRLAAELYATWTPRRLFTFGTSVGWAHWFDDPNTLYRRRNRLTYTRDFSNAAWTKTNILSVTSDADGVGDLVVPTTASSSHNVSQAGVAYSTGNVMRVRAKAGGYNFVAIRIGLDAYAHFNVSAGTVGTLSGATGEIAAAADAPGYYDCTCMTTSAVAGANALIYVAAVDGVLTFTGDGTSGVYIARAQLETYTTTPTEYQDVPTTWEQAYLDAVGAERIFAWQDSAGTTPVTAVGQTIGLSLDRAYGGATGASLLANGATGLTGTATAASYNTSTYAGSVSRAGDASNQSWVTWTGLTTAAMFRIRVQNTGATSLDVRNGGVAGTIIASIAAGVTSYVHVPTSGGSTSITITATANSTTATFTLSQFAAVPGTHLIQATSTSRPTLSARVNLLTYSEQFDNAAWVKTTGDSVTSQGTGLAAVVTANYGTAPNGTTTADRLQLSLAGGANAAAAVNRSGTAQTVTAVTAGAGYKSLLHMKALDGTDISAAITTGQLGVILAAGGPAATYTVTSLADGWVQIASVATPSLTSGTWRIQLYSLPGSTLNTLDVLVWGADLRTADDAAKNIPAYQRVGATAADHDTDGFPHAAYPDGTDDSWASTAALSPGSDKVTVIAGLTKNSDAATGIVCELTAGSSGSFYIGAPTGSGSSKVSFNSRGTVAALSEDTASTYSAPASFVAAGVGDISGDVSSIYVNGVFRDAETSDQGTGNYANGTLYVGRRGGSTLPFNGRIYALIGRFGAMSDTERNRLGAWVKNLMRLP